MSELSPSEQWGYADDPARLRRRRMHIVPVGDLIEHEWVRCPCGPRTKSLRQTDANGETRVQWFVIHHSLDGRELRDS